MECCLIQMSSIVFSCGTNPFLRRLPACILASMQNFQRHLGSLVAFSSQLPTQAINTQLAVFLLGSWLLLKLFLIGCVGQFTCAVQRFVVWIPTLIPIKTVQELKFAEEVAVGARCMFEIYKETIWTVLHYFPAFGKIE